MKFDELVRIVGEEPVFETGLLLVGTADPGDIRRQLSRWVAAGRVHQLRRGLYALAEPFRSRAVHPFVVANQLAPGSYVTAQSALAHYALIPEHVATVISATPGRPARWNTPFGRFVARHLKTDLLWGYERLNLGEGQSAFVAAPEKALLDLVHWQHGSDSLDFLFELRLQNLERLNLERLDEFAQRARRPKWQRVAKHLRRLRESEPQALPL
jgi:predicted transcriptional regulator of viral defense system